MKKTIIAATLLLASVSQADIIKCSFTEPFINSTYSTTQSTLTYEGLEMKTKVIKNVSLQIKSAGVIELVARGGKVLQTLDINGNGSDGMSDRIFPIEVRDNSGLMGSSANNGVGGCTSNQLKATQGEP